MDEGDASEAYGQCRLALIASVMDVISLHCSLLGTGSAPACFSDRRDTCVVSMWPSHWRWNRGSLKIDGGVLEDLPGRFSLLGWVQLVLASYTWGKSHLAR